MRPETSNNNSGKSSYAYSNLMQTTILNILNFTSKNAYVLQREKQILLHVPSDPSALPLLPFAIIVDGGLVVRIFITNMINPKMMSLIIILEHAVLRAPSRADL